MKISIILKILKALFFVVYLFFLLLPNMTNIWFSLLLVFISILILFKAVCFVNDSKLWLGTFLLCVACFDILKVLFQLDFNDVYMIYIFIFGFASLQVFVFFRQNIHLKVFVFCTLEVLLLGISKFAYVTEFEFWYMQIMFLIYIISRLSLGLVNNFRR